MEVESELKTYNCLKFFELFLAFVLLLLFFHSIGFGLLYIGLVASYFVIRRVVFVF